MSRPSLLTVMVSLSIVVATGMVVLSFTSSFELYSSTAARESKLQKYISSLPSEIIIEFDGRKFATPSGTLTTQTTLEHFVPREKGLEVFYSVLLPQSPLPPNPFDKKKVEDWLAAIALQVDLEAKAPAILYQQAKPGFVIFQGEKGRILNQKETLVRVLSLDVTTTSTVSAQTAEVGEVLTPDATIEAEKRASLFATAKIILQTKQYTRTLVAKDLIGLLKLPNGYSDEGIQTILSDISKDVGTPPTEPKLIVSGTTVQEFVAPKDGIGVDSTENATLLISQLQNIDAGNKVEPITLAITKESPKTSLKSTNTLGIEELIGIGESNYSHSIPNRIHNVALTTSRIHSKLVMPGEEFSFNKYLGDVSAATGFKPAYVIKEGQTVLGDGGGVCQVSSTLFRAILNAGLPVTERRGHSYRVSYYEQNSKPGFDATVYSPHPDLRFVNDTGTPILVNAVADSKKTYMYVELYGKSDGRTAQILNYKQWGAQPAPPPLYQDDPTLKPGQLKQIDYAAPGLKTSFDYKVTYPNGEVKDKTFNTTYIPWRAVYLRGI